MKVIIGVEQEPRVQFTLDLASVADLPDLIKLPDGSTVAYNARYASPGERYYYHRVTKEMTFSGEVKPWVQYTELKG